MLIELYSICVYDNTREENLSKKLMRDRAMREITTRQKKRAENGDKKMLNQVFKAQNRRRVFLKAMLLLAPVMILYLVFFVFPFFFSAFVSFNDWNLVTKEFSFVGFSNYAAVFQDSTIGQSVKNTFVYILLTVPVSMVFGLGLAMMINASGRRAKQVFRSILYLPSVTSLAVMGIVWKYLLNPSGGYFNTVLKLFGAGPVSWLQDPAFAMLSISLISIWFMSGYNMVLFTAALMGVNKTLYEAIEIDGGGAFSKFIHITLPQISPMMLFIFITNIMSSFQSFALVNVLTHGGPNNATNVIGYRIWQEAFQFLNSGRAYALSVIVFLVLSGMVIFVIRGIEKKVSYD